MFVFEDDIEIIDPLLDSGVVMAPNNADLVLLSEASLGHVDVSWRKKGRGIRAATKVNDNQKLSNNIMSIWIENFKQYKSTNILLAKLFHRPSTTF
mgnify:CR=1 FL=1